jgi:hypothetical protein
MLGNELTEVDGWRRRSIGCIDEEEPIVNEDVLKAFNRDVKGWRWVKQHHNHLKSG